jgi:uncharacterized membrane protein
MSRDRKSPSVRHPWLRIATAAVLVAAGALFLVFFHLPPHLVFDTGGNTGVIGPVTSRTVTVQPLKLNAGMRITAVDVLLATWGKATNTTNDEIGVFDGKGRLVESVALPPGSVIDNAYHHIELTKPVETTARPLFISLSSRDGSPTNSITSWSNAGAQQGPYYEIPKSTTVETAILSGFAGSRAHQGALCLKLYGLGGRRLLLQRTLAVAGFAASLLLAACIGVARVRRQVASANAALARLLGRLRLQAISSPPWRLVGWLCERGLREYRAYHAGDATTAPDSLGEPRAGIPLTVELAAPSGPGSGGALGRGAVSDGHGQRNTKLLQRIRGINFPKVFLIVALVWGLVLVFLVPPFQNFDELAHYYRAWSVAEGQLRVPPNGIVPVPQSVAELPAQFPIVPIATRQAETNIRIIPDLLWQPITHQLVPSSSFASSYAPIGYIPQAAGVLVARVLGRSPLLSVYLGRLANLLASVLLIFFALRLLPFARPVMFVIALLPMTMLQMSSLSADALLISGTFFFAALTLRYSRTMALDWLHVAALATSAALLLNAKPGYAALAFLVLIIPPSRFASRSRYATAVAATLLATAALAGVIMLTTPDSREVTNQMLGAHNGVDAHAQVAFVLDHPLRFAQVVHTTLGTIGVSLAKQAVGIYAWGALKISNTVAIIGWLALLAALFLREEVRVRRWQRLVLILASLAIAGSVAAGLYVAFTPVGGPVINGLQGRYLYPAALVGLIGVHGLTSRRRAIIVAIILIALALLIASSLRTLLVYYY